VEPELELASRVVLQRGFSKPFQRLDLIRLTRSPVQEQAQLNLSGSDPLIGGLAIPFCGLGQVPGHAPPIRIRGT
jgi:hypothetical protein